MDLILVCCLTSGFVRHLLEYAPQAWMGAAPTHLHQLDRVQRRALYIIGPNAILQSLASRRHVAALSFLYKLFCMSGPDQLTAMVPPLQPPPGPARTRSSHRVQARHAFQLSEQLPAAAPNFLRRAFPHCIVHTWNTWPPSLLSHAPCLNKWYTNRRAWIGLSCVKIWADLSQPFQSYGEICEYAKLPRDCATCRIIEKQESEQKNAVSHCQNYSHPQWVGGGLMSLLACWNGWIIRIGLGCEFSGMVWAHS